jgi:pyruvate/2-oxoglutarate dehydrogenase complex dihydrolipoamide acyltransferase (E2) component
MPEQVVMPRLGESVEEGTISKWLKAEGETIEELEPLVEINTDKVDTEIPSPASGTLLKIEAPEGTVAQVGMVLAWIGEPGEALEGGVKPAPASTGSPAPAPAPGSTSVETSTPAGPSAPAGSSAPAGPSAPAPTDGAASPSPAAAPPVTAPGRHPQLGFISPVVARMAAEFNIDLSKIEGSGAGGRITKKDVQDYLQSQPAPAPAAVPTAVPATPTINTPAPILQPGEIVHLDTMRRRIAEHMVMSKRTSPHVTTVMEVDLSQVVAHREANKDAFARDGARLTFTAYFVAATVAGLKAYPLANSSWTEEGILLQRAINIGMATALGEAGLIVPVIHNADGLSLLGVARAVNDLAERARSKQLKPDEVQGGTFTITNHGTSGSLFATPIINQPQCGILGVGAIQKRVVVVTTNGADSIAIRPMVYLSFTFDHRILDGASADAFLGKVVEFLQNWS